MVTTMKKTLLHSLFVIFPIFYASNSFANRPTELENEQYTAPVEVSAEAINPRPIENATDTSHQKVESKTEIQGDIVQIPASNIRQLDFPRRGMSQDQVQNKLGRPIEIVPAVGKPPISQWIYNDRKVYFEHSSVIHVVAK